MKNFSLPRLAIVLWFFIYALFSIISYLFANGRHEIMLYIVYATIWTALSMVGFGLIEDNT